MSRGLDKRHFSDIVKPEKKVDNPAGRRKKGGYGLSYPLTRRFPCPNFPFPQINPKHIAMALQALNPQEIEWRNNHPLIPEDQYQRLLELDEGWYADEEEAWEILQAYYPEEVEAAA